MEHIAGIGFAVLSGSGGIECATYMGMENNNMTEKEQDKVLELLQSIVQTAVAAQTNVGHMRSLDLLNCALEDIQADATKADRVIAPYRDDPTMHPFKATKGFAECCAICGESEPLHKGGK